MNLSAEIKTGDRRFIDCLLSPLQPPFVASLLLGADMSALSNADVQGLVMTLDLTGCSFGLTCRSGGL